MRREGRRFFLCLVSFLKQAKNILDRFPHSGAMELLALLLQEKAVVDGS